MQLSDKQNCDFVFQSKADHPRMYVYVVTLVRPSYSCDLIFDPMTLACELNLDIPEMYFRCLHTKMKLLGQSFQS